MTSENLAMRIAALYDIHGNRPALEAVLEEVDRIRPDLILVGGDVALGPMPRETLDMLMARGDGVRFIRGNCDREMVEAHRVGGSGDQAERPKKPWSERTEWAARQCTPEQRALLAELPTTLALNVDGLGPTLFCHGSPRSDDEILTAVTPETRLEEVLRGVTQPLVVSGHTHVQYDRKT